MADIIGRSRSFSCLSYPLGPLLIEVVEGGLANQNIRLGGGI